MSIALSLTNFRNRYDSGYILPDTGLVQFAGNSGIGKSNIFKAILWALYGKGTNVIRYGEKSCLVTLQGLTKEPLERSKNINLLKYGEQFSNDDAQKCIESDLNMNAIEFEASSYIMQDQKNSLLSLGPTDQLNLIHSLTFRTDNPNEVKQRIQSKIKEDEATISRLENEIKVEERSVTHISGQISDRKKKFKQIPYEITLHDAVAELSEAKDELQLLSEKEKENDRLVLMYSEDLDNPVRTIGRKADTDLAYLQDLISKRMAWLAREDNQISQEDVNDYMNALSKAELEFLRIKNELDLMKDLNEKAANRHSLINQLDSGREYLIRIMEMAVADFDIEKAKEVSICSAKYVKLHGELAKTKNLSILKSEISKIQQVIGEQDAVVEACRKRLSEGSATLAAQKSAREEIASAKKKIEETEESIKKYRELEPEEEVNRKLLDSRKEFHTIKARSMILRQEIERLQEVIRIFENNEDVHKEIVILTSQLDEVGEKISSMSRELEATTTHLSGLNRLLELTNKAALDAIDATIEEINLRAEYWLNIMFDNALSVKLQTSKELKSKKATVDKINLLILVEAMKIEKKEELSGGQQSRLCLAFQLALSDMYDSPILMLDEAFKGVDADTMKICFKAIREISKRKLVLVVEHFAAPQYFDRIVEVL